MSDDNTAAVEAHYYCAACEKWEGPKNTLTVKPIRPDLTAHVCPNCGSEDVFDTRDREENKRRHQAELRARQEERDLEASYPYLN